jgi:hypothetical protein
MTEARVVTCPECGFQFTEEAAGNVLTRKINPTDWLARCVGDVAAMQDCPSLQARADGVSALDQPPAPPGGVN